MNLTQTTPEQTNSYDSYFVLKRRYYSICPLEARSLSLTEKLYTEFKEVVMSGDLKITEAKGIELTIYSLFCEASSLEKAIKTDIPNDVSLILPPNTQISPKTRTRLATLLVSSPLIQKQSA